MGSFSPVKGSEVTGFPRASHIKVIEEIVEPFGDHTRFLLSRGQLLVLPDQERAQHENRDHGSLCARSSHSAPFLWTTIIGHFLTVAESGAWILERGEFSYNLLQSGGS